MRVNTRYINSTRGNLQLVPNMLLSSEDIKQNQKSSRFRLENLPLVEFMYLVFTPMPGESNCRWLGSLLLCLCDVFQALINSLVCWFFSSFTCLCYVYIYMPNSFWWQQRETVHPHSWSVSLSPNWHRFIYPRQSKTEVMAFQNWPGVNIRSVKHHVSDEHCLAYHAVCKLWIQCLADCRLSQAGIAKPRVA